MIIRTYSELMEHDTFEDRYRYLALNGHVGHITFGFDRHMNQGFYRSSEWRMLREKIILRDNACDLAMPDYEIYTKIYIHHMNPMTVDDIKHGVPSILDPEYLITVTHRTHNAIHFGDERQLPRQLVERKPGDTTLW